MASIHSGVWILCENIMFEATTAILLSGKDKLRTYAYSQMMAVWERWKYLGSSLYN